MNITSDLTKDNNKAKSIASNTILLFLRMFILTLVNLYAVRLVLKGLGTEDYGIFTTIAGVVTTAAVFNSVLALAIQRFFSYAQGLHDDGKLKAIYSCSINIILILVIALFFILESVGLWVVHTQLIIPVERMDAALIIYQLSIAMLTCSFLQIPFMSAVFAHEDMGVYTIISTIECLLKLVAAIVIGYALIDHLQLYVFGLFCTAIIVLILYIVTARRRYQECHYTRVHDHKLYQQLLSFSGWSLFGSLANTGLIQGNTLLLNVFFGPVITAAFGISMQIYNAFAALCNSIVLAFRPPMIKAYAEKRIDYLNQLFYASNKFLVFILIAISVPLIALMDTILNLWLDEVTPDTITFARLTIVYICVISMHNPITIIVQATGKIRNYHLFVESFTLLCLPVSWFMFYMGFSQSFVFVSMIGTCACAHLIRITILKQQITEFSVVRYFKSVILPAFIVCLLTTGTAYFVMANTNKGFIQILLLGFIPFSTTLFSAMIVGFDSHEREFLLTMVKKSILHKISSSSNTPQT